MRYPPFAAVLLVVGSADVLDSIGTQEVGVCMLGSGVGAGTAFPLGAGKPEGGKSVCGAWKV